MFNSKYTLGRFSSKQVVLRSTETLSSANNQSLISSFLDGAMLRRQGIAVLCIKRINHLFLCHQMLILPFPENLKLSLVIHSHIAHPLVNSHPTPTVPAPFSLKLSDEFKTFLLLFFRAKELLSMVHVNCFLVNCPLNHSIQPGDLRASCDPLIVLSRGVASQLCPTGSEPQGGQPLWSSCPHVLSYISYFTSSPCSQSCLHHNKMGTQEWLDVWHQVNVC